MSAVLMSSTFPSLSSCPRLSYVSADLNFLNMNCSTPCVHASNTLPSFLPSFLNAGFTSTSAQTVLGHSECLCSKLRGVKQSSGHAVTVLCPSGPQNICLSACISSLTRCVYEFTISTSDSRPSIKSKIMVFNTFLCENAGTNNLFT